MAAGAAAMMLQSFFDGSISMNDTEIDRRPYHRNCGCALHTLKGACSHAGFQQRNLSFPKKESWDDHSLSIGASELSPQSSSFADPSSGNRTTKILSKLE